MDQLRIGVEGNETIEIPGSKGQMLSTNDSIHGKAAIGGFLGVTEATRDVAF
jgi:hypothetical protein